MSDKKFHIEAKRSMDEHTNTTSLSVGNNSVTGGYISQIINDTNDSDLPSLHLGEVVAIDNQGYPIVKYQGLSMTAESLVPVTEQQIGERCALAFTQGDAGSPVVLGLIWNPNAHVETEKVIVAKESLTLECGKSSLEMDANGTVRLKGVTVTTQAYAANRIKGAAVKIN